MSTATFPFLCPTCKQGTTYPKPVELPFTIAGIDHQVPDHIVTMVCDHCDVGFFTIPAAEAFAKWAVSLIPEVAQRALQSAGTQPAPSVLQPSPDGGPAD